MGEGLREGGTTSWVSVVRSHETHPNPEYSHLTCLRASTFHALPNLCNPTMHTPTQDRALQYADLQVGGAVRGLLRGLKARLC